MISDENQDLMFDIYDASFFSTHVFTLIEENEEGDIPSIRDNHQEGIWYNQ